MDSYTVDQLIRFGTDSFGLERLARFLQAIIQIILSYPLLLNAVLSLSPSGPKSTALTPAGLGALRQQLNLGRRYLRSFRALESFAQAKRLFLSQNQGIDDFLEAAGRAHNGLYLLLELAGLLDACGVPGLAVWGAEGAEKLHYEAQRMWFLSLVFSIAAGMVRFVDQFAPTAMERAPRAAGGDGGARAVVGADADADADADAGDGQKDGEKEQVDDEKETVEAQLEQEERARESARLAEERSNRTFTLARKLATDFLDLSIPGSTIGWMSVSAGRVGLSMLGSTILTSWAFWEHCGAQVRKSTAT